MIFAPITALLLFPALLGLLVLGQHYGKNHPSPSESSKRSRSFPFTPPPARNCDNFLHKLLE